MKINSKAALDNAILELERKKLVQEEALIAQFKATRESLSPVNLIKSSFSQLSEMPGLGEGILKTAAGIGMGVLSKKLFLGKSPNIVKKLLSGVFELAVAKTTITHADKLKAYGLSLYNNLFSKNNKHNHTA